MITLALLVLILPIIFGAYINQSIFQSRLSKFSIYPVGLTFMLAVFYIPVIAAYFMKIAFLKFVVLISIVYFITAICFLVALRKKTDLYGFFSIKLSFSKTTLAAILLIVIQTIVLAIFTYNDPDDSFYLSTATTTLYTNTINQFDPTTGFPFDHIFTRVVFSPFPVYIAYISSLSGVHPTIIAHTIFPIVFIPASYLAVYLIGLEILGNTKKAITFILFLSAINLFSAYSSKNSSIYLIGRIWQGKSILANLMLPMLFLSLFFISKEAKNRYYIFAFIVIFASILSSTSSVFLGPLMILAYSLTSSFLSKSVREAFKYIPLIVPYGLIGLFSQVIK